LLVDLVSGGRLGTFISGAWFALRLSLAPLQFAMDDAASAVSSLDSLPAPATIEASQPFVGRWNHLVSTTNWEKGRIIAQWRAALEEQHLPIGDFSDEAWARLVGGVTGQHVGRLRRVFQRFGQAHEQYT